MQKLLMSPWLLNALLLGGAAVLLGSVGFLSWVLYKLGCSVDAQYEARKQAEE